MYTWIHIQIVEVEKLEVTAIQQQQQHKQQQYQATSHWAITEIFVISKKSAQHNKVACTIA